MTEGQEPAAWREGHGRLPGDGDSCSEEESIGQCLGARGNRERGGPATEPAGYLREREDCSILAGMERKQAVQAEVRRQRAGPRSCREPGGNVILLGCLLLKNCILSRVSGTADLFGVLI